MRTTREKGYFLIAMQIKSLYDSPIETPLFGGKGERSEDHEHRDIHLQTDVELALSQDGDRRGDPWLG
jgi:hypothetical protein